MRPALASVRRAFGVCLALTMVAAASPSQAARMIQSPSRWRVTSGKPVPCDDPLGFAHRTTANTLFFHNTAGQGEGKETALKSAMAAWTRVTGARQVLTYAGTTTAGFRSDYKNTISWDTGACSGDCLALTALDLGPGQEILETDITFNADETWTTDGSEFDTQAVATHELGHTMGIHHTELTTAPRPTMFATYLGPAGQSLEEDDRAALRCGSGWIVPGATSILWQDDLALTVWLMSDGARVDTKWLGLGSNYSSPFQLQGTGDFDGDGHDDILWRSVNDGQVRIWRMVNGTWVFDSYQEAPNLYWQIQGTGDFDGDGRSDILWRAGNGDLNLWLGGDITTTVPAGSMPDTAWQVKAVGDFDGNGFADILWRHDNGQVLIWFMNGGTKVGEALPGGPDYGHAWTIQRLGDFDGDGRSDILWRDVSGYLAIWFSGDINTAAYPTYQNVYPPVPVPLSWQIEGVGDFNKDGRSDILWRDSSGQVAIWFMNSYVFVGDVYPTPLVDSSAHVLGLLREGP